MSAATAYHGSVRPPSELTAAFRAKGLKITPQRQLLFRLLHDDATHPTAEALYVRAHAEMPGISLRTVYQTLSDLAAMGELVALDIGTGATRFDPNVTDHDHLVCENCGMVRDVHAAQAQLVPREPLDGFAITSTEILFRGRCAACGPPFQPPTPQSKEHP